MRVSMLIILVIVLALAMPVTGQEGPTKDYNVKIANITIDGHFEDWAGVQVMSTMDDPKSAEVAEDIMGDFMMAWNGTDMWYLAWNVMDDIRAINTAMTSFGDDPDHPQGVASYWNNDGVEILLQDRQGAAGDMAFKFVLAPDEPNTILYQCNDMDHYGLWLDFGDDINPFTAASEGKERWPKHPPIATVAMTDDGTNWAGEAALKILMMPPNDPGLVIYICCVDIDGAINDPDWKSFAGSTWGTTAGWTAMDNYWNGSWGDDPGWRLQFVEDRITAIEASTWGQVKAAF